MAKLRGREVEKADRSDAQVWSWWVNAARWDFKLTPRRELYRRGLRLDGQCEHLLCVDDAVLFSLGFESGALAFRQEYERGNVCD